jgi:hypothetical protein
MSVKHGTSRYEVRVIDTNYSEHQERLLFTCQVNNKYPFWQGEEGAARLGKMLSDLFADADTEPYAEMAQSLKVQIVNVVESVEEFEEIYCQHHAVLMDPDETECHICIEEKQPLCPKCKCRISGDECVICGE